MKPHRDSTILVLGILSLIVCTPLGIVAWIMGGSDLKEMDAGTMDPSGRGNTQAGKVCGMISTIFTIGVLVVCFIIFALGLVIAVTLPHH